MSAARPADRIAALESLRGIGALIVFVYHLYFAFLRDIPERTVQPTIERWPWHVAIDGTGAVRLFFVLSGVVLSLGFFRNPRSEKLAEVAFLRFPRLWMPASAALVFTVMAALASPAVAACLSWRPLVWLGSVSFSLYLFHVPVMNLIGSPLYVAARDRWGWGHEPAAWLAMAAAFVATFPVAWLMTVTVDRWSREWPKVWYDRWFRPREGAA